MRQGINRPTYSFYDRYIIDDLISLCNSDLKIKFQIGRICAKGQFFQPYPVEKCPKKSPQNREKNCEYSTFYTF